MSFSTTPGVAEFSVKDRAARTGRNPQTGEPIEIKAAKVPGFKAGKALQADNIDHHECDSIEHIEV